MKLICQLAVLAALAGPARPETAYYLRPGDAVLIVTAGEGGAYGDAVNGLRDGLGSASISVSVAEIRNTAGLRRRIDADRPRVVVAVGTEAAAALATEPPGMPVVTTMVLRGADAGDAAAVVSLNVRLTAIIAEMKKAFPDKTRLGVLRRTPRTGPAIQSRDGFTIRYADCPGPEKLIEALLSLKGEVDFVYCPPDPALFNPTTIKPLILASLRSGIPLIGFSESFARAGALASVYPDFDAVGRQTAEAVQRVLAGRQGLRRETPRKLRVAINERVARLLGLRHAGVDDILVIR